MTVSRSAHSVTFPADCMLVAAMNPCPCGYATDPRHTCVCSPGLIRRYRARLSGPLLDRIDLHINVPAVPYEELQAGASPVTSARMRERVLAARAVQQARYAEVPYAGRMPICPAASFEKHCCMGAPERAFSAGSRAEAGAFRPRLYADLADKPDDCGSRRIGIHRRSPSGRGYRLPRAGQGSVLASALPSNGGGGLSEEKGDTCRIPLRFWGALPSSTFIQGACHVVQTDGQSQGRRLSGEDGSRVAGAGIGVPAECAGPGGARVARF